MNKKIKAARDNYIKEHNIFDGGYSSAGEISDEELKFHMNMQAMKEIKELRESVKAYLLEIYSSIRTIKAIMIFWSILGAIGLGLYIVTTIRTLKILGIG